MSESNQTTIKGCCPRCGADNALAVGQRSYRGKLRWYETVSCTCCGLHSEADGIGIPPEEIQQKIIHTDGLWQLHILQLKSKANAVKVIRDALSLEMKDVSQLAKGLPGNLFTGTREEALWIADLLIKVGESPIIERIE